MLLFFFCPLKETSLDHYLKDFYKSFIIFFTYKKNGDNIIFKLLAFDLKTELILIYLFDLKI